MLCVPVLLILAQMALGKDKELDEKYKTMPRHEFIEYFNSQNFSWKITNYNRTFRLGVQDQSDKMFMDCKQVEILKDLPKNFDSREQWPQCESIKEINDQGQCDGSCMFAVANMASDRTCIHKDIHVHLSEQDFQCSTHDNVCEMLRGYYCLEFWQYIGIVTNTCKPYDVNKLISTKCKLECENKSISYDEDKYVPKEVYPVCSESMDSIRSEIVKNGPIQTGFYVYEDFMDYKNGIYVHTYGKQVGVLHVRVIGYGVENDIKYWLVANSWGKKWGEEGTFRIKIKQNVGFEYGMMAGIP